MLSRREAFLAILVQSFGSLATMAVTVVIAHRFGPSGQGFWANFKSLVDFVSTVAAYGFPAGFPFLINVRQVSDLSLFRFSALYCGGLLPLIAIAVWFAWFSGLIRLLSATPDLEIALITLASGALTLNAMIRGLTLAVASTSVFSAVTALPPFLLCALLLAWPLSTINSLMWVASAAALLGLLGCLGFWLTYRRPQADAVTETPVRELVTFGGWNFAVSVATALVLVVTLQVLSASGTDVAEIGQFSVAVLIQGALLTPGNMLGPVIYNAWSRAASADMRYASYASLQRLALPIATCACIAIAPLLSEILPVLVGGGFEGALWPTWILLLAVPFGYWLRLMANVLLAVGAAHVYAFSAIARLLSVVAILAFSGAPGIQTAAIAWVTGEVIAVLICVLGLRYSLGWSFSKVMGIRPAVIAESR